MIFKLGLCLAFASCCLYSYIDKQNDLTELQMQIPQLVKEIKMTKEENTRLHYEIEQFENPQHLIELSRQSEFSHLKYPLIKDILILQEGIAIHLSSEKEESLFALPKTTLAFVEVE